jgi:hypothetical protein
VLADDAVFAGRLSGSGCVAVSDRFEGDCEIRAGTPGEAPIRFEEQRGR